MEGKTLAVGREISCFSVLALPVGEDRTEGKAVEHFLNKKRKMVRMI